MKLGLHSLTSVSYKLQVLRGNRIVKETPFRPYLITDAALDNVASTSWLELLTTPILGENATPTPVRRDGGAVTFTQAGNTLTASASFFSAADVGRLFKWGTGAGGNEIYITGYTDNQNVTVGGAPASVSSTVGTVWYVNTAALLTPITGLTWTKETGSAYNYSSCATAGAIATVTHHTTFISSAFGSAKTLTEIAFNSSDTNTDVNDRDVISPSVSLLSGDQARVILEVQVSYTPITPQAVANFATGYDSSGIMQIEALSLGIDWASAIRYFSAPGDIVGSACLEPGYACSFFAWNDWTPQAFDAGGSMPAAALGRADGSLAGYGTGTFFRDTSGTFSITQANATIYGVVIGRSLYYGVMHWLGLKFTTPVVKIGTQTLSFTFRKSWGRVLTN
jgi:hypothetical protein